MTKTELQSVFADSPTRPAGYRQALEINGEEYGFRWIPPGEFDMGSPESEVGRRDGETLHHVKLTRGFWILETPITQRLYRSVMDENPSCFKEFDFSKLFVGSETFDDVLTRAFKGDFSDLPVERVSFDKILDFCETLSKSLPFGMAATRRQSARVKSDI